MIQVPGAMMKERHTEDLEAFLVRMQPTLNAALTKLADTSFRSDPIGGAKYSRATSIISSAYKRHGQILGRALLERLKDCGRFQVWTEDEFKLGPASRLELQKAMPPAAYREISMLYGEYDQTIPVDLLVFDSATGGIGSYNVKRGNGEYDAGKKRLILNELLRTQMHLRDYARSMGLPARGATAYIVFYYGLRSIPEPFSLVGDDLDQHFGFPVQAAIEAVNARFRDGLYALIEHGAI